VMLRIIAARVDPAAAKTIADHMLALHRATTVNWADAQREARAVREAANQLIPVLAGHDFTREDMRALADGLIAAELAGDDIAYPGAEQATMALSSIVNAMKVAGYASEQQAKTMNDALNGLYEAVAKDDTYKPAAFLVALRDFQKVMPRP